MSIDSAPRLTEPNSGATKAALTNLSEAQSYLNLALARGLLDSTDTLRNSSVTPSLRERTFLDTYATESYQNILFPLLQFTGYLDGLSVHACQPRTPKWLIVISHDFKRRRFMELHLPAIKFPAARTAYVGIDPLFEQDEDKGERRRKEIIEGDLKRGFGVWKEDLYGVGEVLSAKRKDRGWSEARLNGLLESCALVWQENSQMKTMQSLLTWRGGQTSTDVFPERVPWEDGETE